ncbi:MAG: hypothetical protein MJ066_02415, partial [Clostridia bacterium]|nr:hypothetical protein [Clostridia bacterium]
MAKIVTSLELDEKTFQIEFYKKIVGDNVEIIIDRSTDGRSKGMLFEHKQNLTVYGKNKALSQAIIYLCRFNRDGIPVPSKIMLISQEENKAFIYKTENYLSYINDIETYALMAASSGINGFSTKEIPIEISFDLNSVPKSRRLSDEIENTALHPEYVKININKHNVYGWSQFYYSNAPIKKQKKSLFFKELKHPCAELKDYIEPWIGSEVDFSLIMDLLNDPLQQKKLGAFYTPPLYAVKAVSLVRMAIKNVPKGNDYIILDRCAGTGALEKELNEEELSHVVVSTYELKEWHALKDRLGKLVRCVIPPIPSDPNLYPSYDKDSGTFFGANAMEEDFLPRREIKQYVDNPNCNIILFENPPYSDDAADTPLTGESRNNTASSFMSERMNEEVKAPFKGLILSKEIDNLFIWSGFKYYLKKPNDAYILFSPIKYWKTAHLVNKTFIKGYLFNREHFHANPSAISCIYWSNKIPRKEVEELTLEAIDIEDDKTVFVKNIVVKKVHTAVSETLFDVDQFKSEKRRGIYCQRNGLEGKKEKSTGTINYYNDDIVGWLHLVGFAFDSKNIDLVRNTLNLRKNGFYLTRENFVKKLPLFSAKAFPQLNWWEKDLYSTTGDGGKVYENDEEFLKKCLIFSCLTQKNRCRSMIGSDNVFYKNELCFENGTLASEKLNYFEKAGIFLTQREKNLIQDYKEIIEE